ncbi:homogentisate 1,2-dioxygenase [Sphingomonas sp. 8AM]|uniref:homogentisate 1,2-dioxygenase n=1 Tax=Sphingomonas sp. 8AM TaxID=2653170 RepID=UPI0012F2B608|nr:homogentisate 1,2-dioxygenase [Sphingomonas sp. 8AM]VXD04163.1 conserved exported hypothetical protein [Sphingomonas sp. 8AM]
MSFALSLLLASAPFSAQDLPAPEPSCNALRPALPVGFEGWSTRVALEAGAATRHAPVLAVGRAAELRLVPLDRLAPAAPPTRDLGTGTNAGVALFQVTRPGTYRIALGGPAWIEVVRGGRPLPATAQGHGPACSGIRKIVDYRLAPGRYVLQLTGAATNTLPVLIAPAPEGAA